MTNQCTWEVKVNPSHSQVQLKNVELRNILSHSMHSSPEWIRLLDNHANPYHIAGGHYMYATFWMANLLQ